MRKLAKAGGLVASVILIALGVVSMVIGASGRDDVRDKLATENIVGSPDMDPAAIEVTVTDEVPDCSVAGEKVDTGDEARCFADYMRIHALELTGGQTYAEMPRFLDKQGNPTADEKKAAISPESGAPVSNPEREIWVTETALATALNTSYFAEQVAMFGVAVGVALIVIGIGFLALVSFGALGPPRREP
jgi:hypothetical protein